MLALIAPDDSAGGQPGVLRLGVGRLAAEIVRRMDAAAAGAAPWRCRVATLLAPQPSASIGV